MTNPVFIRSQSGHRMTIERADIIGFWPDDLHPGRTTITTGAAGRIVIDESFDSFIDRMSAGLAS